MAEKSPSTHLLRRQIEEILDKAWKQFTLEKPDACAGCGFEQDHDSECVVDFTLEVEYHSYLAQQIADGLFGSMLNKP